MNAARRAGEFTCAATLTGTARLAADVAAESVSGRPVRTSRVEHPTKITS